MTLFQQAKAHFLKSSLWDFLFLVFFSTLTAFFLAITLDESAGWFATPGQALKVFLLLQAFVFLLWFGLLWSRRESKIVLRNARISCAPGSILFLIIPFTLFPVAPKGVPPFGVVAIIFFGIVLMNITLRAERSALTAPRVFPWAAWAAVGIYTVFLGASSVLRYLNYQNTSSFDVALYNQIQWNNIHGHFFESSISGSNFVTHNSPFLLLLSPFYGIYPHPVTLLILKTLFLGFSAVPFYLIAQKSVSRQAIFPLLLVYLFHPFIVGQNFNAPHEMCFSLPFLLFSYYFFITGRFKNFLIFLLLSLLIKEHLALLSVMYGLYALCLKRERRWVVVPIMLGIAWAAFSLGIMAYFQTRYQVDPYPAWLIDNIKSRFLSGERDAWESLRYGLRTSLLGSSDKSLFIYTLFSPLAVIFPFLSPVMLLGMPEFIINLLASIPLLYPTWHYNILTSCFLILSCVRGIPQLSLKPWWQRIGISPEKTQELLALFLLLTVVSHAFLWWPYLVIEKNPAYVQTMAEALRLIPAEASVSAPKSLVAYVSSRRDYFLLEDKRKGDYVVLDHGEGIPQELNGLYAEIFQKNGVRIYKRK
jgi:uncharacterized membrane protein